jgi:hypothetical protein
VEAVLLQVDKASLCPTAKVTDRFRRDVQNQEIQNLLLSLQPTAQDHPCKWGREVSLKAKISNIFMGTQLRVPFILIPMCFVCEVLQNGSDTHHQNVSLAKNKWDAMDASGNTVTGWTLLGQPIGPYIHRSKDQKIFKVGLYENGSLNGSETMWHTNGKISQQTAFRFGIRQGSYREWSETGLLLRESEYEKGIEISQKAWRESGELYANYKLRNGRYFGLKGGRLCQMAPTRELRKISLDELK